MSVNANVGLELLATTLADKHMANVLTYCVLVRGLQGLESLVTVISEVNHLSLMCFMYLYDMVVLLLFAGKNLKAATAKVAR